MNNYVVNRFDIPNAGYEKKIRKEIKIILPER